jgi:hypothetical protein
MFIDICCQVYMDFSILLVFLSRIHRAISLNFVVEYAYLNVVFIASSV